MLFSHYLGNKDVKSIFCFFVFTSSSPHEDLLDLQVHTHFLSVFLRVLCSQRGHRVFRPLCFYKFFKDENFIDVNLGLFFTSCPFSSPNSTLGKSTQDMLSLVHILRNYVLN